MRPETAPDPAQPALNRASLHRPHPRPSAAAFAGWIAPGLLALTLASSLCLQASPEPNPATASRCAFRPSTDGGFDFDTGVLRGQLRAAGKSLGLSSVVHVPSGQPLARSNGLFSHYRVFTVGKRYGGGAWDWPSTATLQPDGAVLVDWPAAEGRPFTLQALYRWHDPRTLDLETRVTPSAPLKGFEVFLASYFGEAFTNSLAFASAAPAAGSDGFLHADHASGAWQMFPRDDAAVRLIQDGRWKLEPNPVDWVIRPRFTQPIAVRRAPGSGVSAVLMAPATDCFAIATPFEAEGHYSTYLALFGRDLPPGQTATARTRLVIGVLLDLAPVSRLYHDYIH